MRIGVDEDQPVAGRSRRARVACARDLIDRLEDDLCLFLARDEGGPVGRIVVADDEFPAAGAVEGPRRRLDAIKRPGEQALLVERRNDDRQLQARCFLKWATVRSQDSFAAASL